VGAAIVLPYCVYWLIRFDNGAAAFWAVIFAAITILALVFLWRPEVGRWLSGRLAAGNPGATGRGR
jgi:Na+-driven multidrug efflux pump